ncbi:unnamed protein product [Moneuplotes crassus]|uniref:Uncharacterized protein n=1 Tax=Euplotes crassus TaxID=5936 RepID=A0AAD1U629_EUPCR|nr:unnamed protein product [Moneuplotes crassus]
MARKTENESQNSRSSAQNSSTPTQSLRKTRSARNRRKRVGKTDYYYPDHDKEYEHNSPDSSSFSDRAEEKASLKYDQDSSNPRQRNGIATRNLRSSTKLRANLANCKPKKPPIPKQANTNKRNKTKKEEHEEEDEWEIPSNLQTLFGVFSAFIKDFSTLEEDEEQYQQESQELSPEMRQRLELHQFIESLETEDERNICEYLLKQNVTDPTTIRALIDQIQAQARAQQLEVDIANPEEEIERSRKAIESLNALNHENLQNNLNYAFMDGNLNRQHFQNSYTDCIRTMLNSKLNPIVNQNHSYPGQFRP